MNKNILILIITLVFSLCGASSSYAVNVGESVKLVTTTLDGKSFDLAALKGKVVIVHFWATWCASCREEMPALDDFYRNHHAEGVEVMAIGMDRPRARDKVAAYMKDFHMPASLISDASDNGFSAPAILPVTYIIATDGTVSRILTPDREMLTRQSLHDVILPMLPKH